MESAGREKKGREKRKRLNLNGQSPVNKEKKKGEKKRGKISGARKEKVKKHMK